jgi:hypothetical protein
MKYAIKHPVVDAIRVTQTGLPPINGVTPVIGNYIITDPFGDKKLLTTEQLLSALTLQQPQPIHDPKMRQLFMLAQGIVDAGTMVDDSNAETLLNEAVDKAHEILRLLAE